MAIFQHIWLTTYTMTQLLFWSEFCSNSSGFFYLFFSSRKKTCKYSLKTEFFKNFSRILTRKVAEVAYWYFSQISKWVKTSCLFWDIQSYLCLFLLQVPKCFVPVQIFCVVPKIYLHIVPVTNILCQNKRWFAFSKIGF